MAWIIFSNMQRIVVIAFEPVKILGEEKEIVEKEIHQVEDRPYPC
jgi:hypothetical protein